MCLNNIIHILTHQLCSLTEFSAKKILSQKKYAGPYYCFDSKISKLCRPLQNLGDKSLLTSTFRELKFGLRKLITLKEDFTKLVTYFKNSTTCPSQLFIDSSAVIATSVDSVTPTKKECNVFHPRSVDYIRNLFKSYLLY